MTNTTYTSRTLMLALRSASIAFATLGFMMTTATTAPAQAATQHRSRWEFLVTSGKLLPTGSQRAAIARGGITAAQLTFVPGPVAITATLGWARSRDIASPGSPKLDAFLYDIAAEVRGPRLPIGPLSLMPFGGAGVGGRSYNYRSIEMDATHNLTAFVSAGGELGTGRVQLRVEVRDYVTAFKPLNGLGAADSRNDLVLMAGLRIRVRQ